MKAWRIYTLLEFINARNLEEAAKNPEAVPHIGYVTEGETIDYLNRKFELDEAEINDIISIALKLDLIGRSQVNVDSPMRLNITWGPRPGSITGEDVLKKRFGFVPTGFINFWYSQQPRTKKVVSVALTFSGLAGLVSLSGWLLSLAW